MTKSQIKAKHRRRAEREEIMKRGIPDVTRAELVANQNYQKYLEKGYKDTALIW